MVGENRKEHLKDSAVSWAEPSINISRSFLLVSSSAALASLSFLYSGSGYFFFFPFLAFCFLFFPIAPSGDLFTLLSFRQDIVRTAEVKQRKWRPPLCLKRKGTGWLTPLTDYFLVSWQHNDRVSHMHIIIAFYVTENTSCSEIIS